MSKKVLATLTLLAIVLAAGIGMVGYAQGSNEPVIVWRESPDGEYTFTVQFPEPVEIWATRWTINGVVQEPEIIPRNKPLKLYFPKAGPYTIKVDIWLGNKTSVSTQTNLNVGGLGSPLERQAKQTQQFVYNYVVPFIVGVTALLTVLGIKLV